MTRANNFTGKSTDSVAGLRFLVVDDHKFIRHITIEALKWLNANNITEAADGGEAIKLLQGASSFNRNMPSSAKMVERLELSDDRLFGLGKFDCVISDFNMRPLNGLHLLKAIRTGEAKCERDTPFFMLTGFSNENIIAAALALDVNAFVLKPISRIELGQKLGRVLMRPIEANDVEVYQDVDVPEYDRLADLHVDVGLPVDDQKKKNWDENFSHRPVETVTLESVLANPDSAEKVFLGEDLLLGADVFGPDGAIFIHAGTKLTGLLLEKLNELNKAGIMADDLKIVR